MNQTLFQHPRFGQLTVSANAEGKPLFKANDVAVALGYKRPQDAIRQHCKGVGVLPTPSAKGLQPTKYISESDVYRLVMRSKLPEAERFQDWVVEEVLPCIRRHGAYMTDSTRARLDDDPEAVKQLTSQLEAFRVELEASRQQTALCRAELQASRRDRDLNRQLVQELSPKADYFDRVMYSPQLIRTTQIAQDLGMSAVKLNRLLADLNVHYRINGQWVLYAKYKDCGYVRSRTVITPDGKPRLDTYWTPLGRQFIHNLLSNPAV